MKAGRELELLVTKIKEMLHPEARIESPAHVRDCDTNELREVDVGVWNPVDKGEIFIAVECRDRGAVQDVTWIEQLIAKKQSIGADLLIAVTSSKFTQPAIVKAAKRGVIVRTMSEALAEEIADWTREAYIDIRSCRIEISDAVLNTRIGKVIAKHGTLLNHNGKDVTFDEFISGVLGSAMPVVAPKIPRQGDTYRARLRARVSDLYVILPYRAFVEAYDFEAIFTRHIEMLPVASGFSYEDAVAASQLVEGYQFRSDYGAAGDVLINTDTQQGRLVLDFSKYTGWVDQTVLKAGRPIALTSVVLIQRHSGPAA